MDENTRTFSQDELNAILKERLSKERNKILQEVMAKEAELNKREALINAKADWNKKGLPCELLELLDCSNSEALETASTILERMNNKPIPVSGGFDMAGGSIAVPVPTGNSDQDRIRRMMGI